jgi:UrcA family protein
MRINKARAQSLSLQPKEDTMKTPSIVFATMLTSALIGTAHAARPGDEARQRVVSFADLDLSQNADAKRLYRRINAAAREVCWTSGVLAVTHGARMQQCVKEATERAIADVNAPAIATRLVEDGE